MLIQSKTKRNENFKNYKTLVQEAMGIDNLSDEEFTKIKDKANELIAIMDKINFSPTKGRNPYLSLALQTLEKGYPVDTQSHMTLDMDKQVSSANVQDIPDIQNPGFKVREGHSFRVIKDSSTVTQYTNKDLELKAQALNEAIAISHLVCLIASINLGIIFGGCEKSLSITTIVLAEDS